MSPIFPVPVNNIEIIDDKNIFNRMTLETYIE